ncbi:hypothetical protein GGS24DRAFT_419943 [Hypoxylon argillaceum]|nr:hypothetical protein GGS24DRAFT_419943 [Hypoxylon argillaceum]KAI1146265.1 hypothetical protein F4825DRAFT_202049 [Nemania diffusa]
MGVLSKTTTISIMAIEICVLVAIGVDGVGPALEAPAHLGIFGRVAYYTFHRRFRDFFVPYYTIGLVRECLHVLKGDLKTPFWFNSLFLLSGCWLWAYMKTTLEAFDYSDRPYTVEEEKLWTEGMTRREFLKRKRG